MAKRPNSERIAITFGDPLLDIGMVSDLPKALLWFFRYLVCDGERLDDRRIMPLVLMIALKEGPDGYGLRPIDLPTGINESGWHRWEFIAGPELIWMMLDAYESTGDKTFLDRAKTAIDPCNEHLWDKEYGAWLPGANRDWSQTEGTTKLTHIIADMIQANYRLYLLQQGDTYRDRAERGLAFLIDHARAPNGLWYRHTTRDGSDPKPGPDLPADGKGQLDVVPMFQIWERGNIFVCERAANVSRSVEA